MFANYVSEEPGLLRRSGDAKRCSRRKRVASPLESQLSIGFAGSQLDWKASPNDWPASAEAEAVPISLVAETENKLRVRIEATH